jgi:DNA-directed RNA polymerase sigma subunit (sigma70/sigma32)
MKIRNSTGHRSRTAAYYRDVSRRRYEKLRRQPGEVFGTEQTRAGLTVVTIQQVADHFGVSKQAIHLSERSALRKIRAALESDWKQFKEFHN